MGKFIDLTGKRFGRLIVIKRVENDKNNLLRWLCKCDCGNECIVLGGNLRRDHTQSCGCLNLELISERSKKYNDYDLSKSFGIGYTYKNQPFYFDLEDYDKIKNYCWHYNKYGYVVTTTKIEGKNIGILLHCLLIGNTQNKLVDHKNNKRFDCRKENLRLADDSQNSMNKKMQRNNTSGIIGVWWNKKNNKWQAEIKAYKKKIYLGLFDNIEDAAKARKEAEIKYFKEFQYKGDNEND